MKKIRQYSIIFIIFIMAGMAIYGKFSPQYADAAPPKINGDQIQDGAIKNNHINATAAIDSGKISFSSAVVMPGTLTAVKLYGDGSSLSGVAHTVNPENQRADVKAATWGNITLSGEQTIDNVALVQNDRVLVKAQAASQNNGIYIVKSGAWQRSSDMLSATGTVQGSWTIIEYGDQGADTGWYIKTAPANFGTDPIEWAQFSGEGSTGIQYLQLDSANSPLTGNLGITKSGPSLTLTDQTQSSTLVLSKSNTDLEAKLENLSDITSGAPIPYAANFPELNTAYFNCTDIAGIDGASNLTVAFWFQAPSYGSNEYDIVTKQSASVETFGIGIRRILAGSFGLKWAMLFKYVYTGHSAYAYYFDGTSQPFGVPGTWNYGVFTYNGAGSGDAGKLKFYLNGNLKTLIFPYYPTYLVPTTLADSGTAPVIIGNNYGYFNGPYANAIDEVQLYTLTWAAGDVTTNYGTGGDLGKGRAGLIGDTGLLAGWHFDETSGNASDYGAGGKTCTLNGGVTRVSSTKAWQAGGTPATHTVIVFSSKSPSVAADGYGINTYGDPDAGTVIDGKYITLATGTTVTDLTCNGTTTGCGGSSATPTLQIVTAVGATTTNPITVTSSTASPAITASGTTALFATGQIVIGKADGIHGYDLTAFSSSGSANYKLKFLASKCNLSVGSNTQPSLFSNSFGVANDMEGGYSFGAGYNNVGGNDYDYLLGYVQTAFGRWSSNIGAYTTTQGEYSNAYGFALQTLGDFTFVLGQGANVAAGYRLYNDKPSSLMVGFNSNIPTLYVGTSSGQNTIGTVGLGTATGTAIVNIGEGNATATVYFGGKNIDKPGQCGALGKYQDGTQAYNKAIHKMCYCFDDGITPAWLKESDDAACGSW